MSYSQFFIERKLLYTQLIKVVIGKYPGQFLGQTDGPLENFFGGGGGGRARYITNIRAREN